MKLMTIMPGAVRLLPALAGLLLTGGCAVGPDFHSPAPDAPGQDDLAGAAASPFSTEAPPERWWRLYEEPGLNEAVQEALAANTDLRAAQANLRRARAVLRETGDQRWPSTSINGSSTRSRQNLGGALTLQNTINTIELDMSYQFDLFGRVQRAIEASRADLEAVQATRDVTRITVAAETARTYALACSTNYQLDVLRQSLGLQERSLELTQRLLDAGRGTALDVASARAQLEQTRAGIPSLQAQHRIALLQLAALMGREPTDYPDSAAQCSEPPALAGEIPVGDGASLLRRRPDLRRAERELAAATARVGLATASLYPNVSFGATAGLLAIGSGDLLDDDAAVWSLGPVVSWSFPNNRAARARVDQAEAAADAALARFDGAWLEALRETESVLSDYVKELQRRQALTDARDASQEATQLANARFDAGQLNFLDVLQTELTLTNARMELAQSEARLADLQVSLFLALGGGWNDDAS